MRHAFFDKEWSHITCSDLAWSRFGVAAVELLEVAENHDVFRKLCGCCPCDLCKRKGGHENGWEEWSRIHNFWALAPKLISWVRFPNGSYLRVKKTYLQPVTVSCSAVLGECKEKFTHDAATGHWSVIVLVAVWLINEKNSSWKCSIIFFQKRSFFSVLVNCQLK